MTSNRKRRAVAICLSATLFSVLSGCGAATNAEPGWATSAAVPELGQAGYVQQIAADYLLRPSDVISVQVFREADLSRESVPLSADGLISLPLIGTIRAAGRTPADLEAEITQALMSRFLRNPDVSVNVLQYASHLVTVEGAVTSPGVYPFQPGARLSGSLALAEGALREAALDDVVVFRQVEDGIAVARFDYRAVRAGTMLDPVLQPGDRVVVGLDGLSVFWQDLITSLPAFALFTRF